MGRRAYDSARAALFGAEDLPIPVGRNSEGLVRTIDLCATPHLFVSYTTEWQLEGVMASLFDALLQKTRVRVFAAVDTRHRRMAECLPGAGEGWTFHVRDDPESGTLTTSKAFVDEVHAEFRRRSKKRDGRLVVLMDDLWEVVRGLDRRRGRRFMELLKDGPEAGMHFATASSTGYRNLLLALMGGEAPVPGGDPLPLRTLGSEVYHTAENLVFLRLKGSTTVERLFAMDDGMG